MRAAGQEARQNLISICLFWFSLSAVGDIEAGHHRDAVETDDQPVAHFAHALAQIAGRRQQLALFLRTAMRNSLSDLHRDRCHGGGFAFTVRSPEP